MTYSLVLSSSQRVKQQMPTPPRGRSTYAANARGRPMWNYYQQTVDWLFRLDSQEWFLAMCAALVIGFLALRGFGSRSNY